MMRGRRICLTRQVLHSNTTPWVTQCVTLKLLCYDCVITFVLSLCNRLVSHCV
jgi:hypothetical protein